MLELNSIQNQRAYWKCICDCGNITHVSSHELLSGDTKSCGCQKESFGEELINNLLI